MSLDELEKEIYSYRKQKNEGTEEIPSEPLSPVHSSEGVKKGKEAIWDADAPKEESYEGRKTPIMKRIFIVAGVIAVLAVVGFFAVQYIFNVAGTSKDVGVEIFAPDHVYRGVPFEVTVQISSQADTFMRNANLTLTMTSGLVSLDSLNNKTVLIDSVGDLGGGSLTKKVYKFLSVGDPNSIQKVTAQLGYALGNSSARYEVKQEKQLTIDGPAISISVKKPDTVVGGSKFDLEVQYENLSDFSFPDVRLEMKYPTAFEFKSATLTPTSMNNYWQLGGLNTGSKGTLGISGDLQVSDQNSFNIPVDLYVSFLGQDYLVNEQLVTLSISPSPIHFDISLNGATDYVARAGDTLRYAIKYQNNSGIALADVVIRANLLGELFDFKTLQTNGNFNSLANSVTWNASNVPALHLLDPGASGEVSIQVRLASYFPIKSISDRNYSLKVSTEIDSPSVPYYLTADKTSAVAAMTTKIMGSAAVSTKTLYRDAASGIVNDGALPPQVNKPTEFTIHWFIKNYSTDLSNVTISAPLASGVRWTGVEKSNLDSVPLYNDRTNTVEWTIDKIPATRGALGDPIEVTFQVELTPNVTQVNQYARLLGQTTLKGTDGFTGMQITATADPIDTSLSQDPTVGQGQGIVSQ